MLPRVEILELIDAIKSKGYELGWKLEREARAEDGIGCSVVYDDEGEYLRVPDRPFNQVLVKSSRKGGSS